MCSQTPPDSDWLRFISVPISLFALKSAVGNWKSAIDMPDVTVFPAKVSINSERLPWKITNTRSEENKDEQTRKV